MGSTRLPGKTMTPIAGKPLLEHVLERAAKSELAGKIVVATTVNPEDDMIEQFASAWGAEVFRGSSDDVLDRYCKAARRFELDTIVRLTADDPFKDPEIVDRGIGLFLCARGQFDYVSNNLRPSYPDGLDVEVFKFSALETAWREARKPSHREHVTPYIWMQPERFALYSFAHTEDLSHLRWTLDNPQDLQFARAVYEEIYTGEPFSMQAVLDLLARRPELAAINQGFRKNEAFWKTIAAENGLAEEARQ
jgi:spore coat polysaccharide biosynthesis protein SpsF